MNAPSRGRLCVHLTCGAWSLHFYRRHAHISAAVAGWWPTTYFLAAWVRSQGLRHVPDQALQPGRRGLHRPWPSSGLQASGGASVPFVPGRLRGSRSTWGYCRTARPRCQSMGNLFAGGVGQVRNERMPIIPSRPEGGTWSGGGHDLYGPAIPASRVACRPDSRRR
jgi:hypothetical protein